MPRTPSALTTASGAPREIQLRQICHFFRAALADGLGAGAVLGIDLVECTFKVGALPAR